MRFLFFLFLVLSVGMMRSQSFDIVYKEISRREIDRPQETYTDYMMLEIRGGMSLYYSKLNRLNNSVCDSLKNIGQTLAENPEIRQRLKDIRPFHLQVAKNYPQRGVFTNSDYIMEFAYYEDELPVLRWKISNKRRVILGYDCVMAETDLYGRHWVVWYAEEIPLSEGPWLLNGLPGLILAAEDDEQIFSMEAVGMQKKDQVDINILNKGKLYSKKRFWESRREHDENPSAAIKRFLGFTSNKTQFVFHDMDENGNFVTIDEYPPVHLHYYEKE